MNAHVSWGWLEQSASEWRTIYIFTSHLLSSGMHFPSTPISQPLCSVLKPKCLVIDTEGRFQGSLPGIWGWEMSVPSKACWVIIIRASPRILTLCPNFIFFLIRKKWLSKQVAHSCPGWLKELKACLLFSTESIWRSINRVFWANCPLLKRFLWVQNAHRIVFFCAFLLSSVLFPFSKVSLFNDHISFAFLS